MRRSARDPRWRAIREDGSPFPEIASAALASAALMDASGLSFRNIQLDRQILAE
jgi:hypothetical protein